MQSSCCSAAQTLIFIFQMQTVKAALAKASTRLYVVQIDRAIEQSKGPLRMRSPTLPPVITAQLISELAQYSGGRIYRRNWDLREILNDIRR